jgi:hypothetical protein
LVVGLKSKIQLFIVYKKYSSLAKTYTYWMWKDGELCYKQTELKNKLE